MSFSFSVLVSYYSHIEKNLCIPHHWPWRSLHCVHCVRGSPLHSFVHLGFSSPVLISHQGWMLFGSAMSFIKPESLSPLDSPEDGSLPLIQSALHHGQCILFVRVVYSLTGKGRSDTLQFLHFFLLYVLFVYIDIHVCNWVKCPVDGLPEATPSFRNCWTVSNYHFQGLTWRILPMRQMFYNYDLVVEVNSA